jgi:hypothetical protein
MRKAGLLLASALVISGCIFGSDDELDTAKWDLNKTKLSSFTYKFTRYCECLEEDVGPFLVQSTPAMVLQVRRVRQADTVDVVEGLQAFSIDSLIATTRANLARTHASASIRYNPEYGFPEFVYIDFNVTMADEEYQWEITNFEATAQ